MRNFPGGIPKESIFYPGFYIVPSAVVGWEDMLYMMSLTTAAIVKTILIEFPSIQMVSLSLARALRLRLR